ncbi:MAG: hypothetical protein JWO25_1488 [Alphaproteobacteria bacterium]|nr:hypothetical protein [Alphaproteobacteria bacterium]MDB5721723.1 hypothetical protein [Alphaproteobacteria bacterium]
MEELEFLRREARKCREAALRTADRTSRHGMDELARLYERQAMMIQRRAIQTY